MKYKKETTWQMLHTLWVRMWDFMIRFINEMDGDEVAEAIKAINDPNHPFYIRLKEAFDTLKLKLRSDVSPIRWTISEVSDRPPIALLAFLATGHKGQTFFNIFFDELREIFQSYNYQERPGAISLKFLKFNTDLDIQSALREAYSRGFDVPDSVNALRFVTSYLHAQASTTSMPLSEITECGGGPIVFANSQDPSRSVIIKGGGMGGWDVLPIGNFRVVGIVVMDKPCRPT